MKPTMLNILICTALFLVFISTSNNIFAAENDNEAPKMDAVLVIDNSGSMDWPGHDTPKNRFESARIFIDKAEEGDQIALIDFSGTCELIFPLTKVTPGRKSIMRNHVSQIKSDRQLTDIHSALKLAFKELSGPRANPMHTPVVILLTDGEIDVVTGSTEKKKHASKESEKQLFEETIPHYVENYIPIYTIGLNLNIDTSVLERLAEITKLEAQVNELHYFLVSPGSQLIEVFSVIFDQIKKRSRVSNTYHFDGTPIQQSTDVTHWTKKLNIDVLLEHKGNLDIALLGPDGRKIKPTTHGDKYKLFQIENPVDGQWDVLINGTGENEVIIATNIEDDLKIDLPFSSRTKVNEKMLIFANLMYQNAVVNSSVAKVKFRDEIADLHIRNLVFSVETPDGKTLGPFEMKQDGGSFNYLFDKTESVGNYTFDFTLKAMFMEKSVNLTAQKKVHVFQPTASPQIVFAPLQEHYISGDSIIVELDVTENARLLQNSFLPLEIKTPSAIESHSIPRVGLKKYRFIFKKTNEIGTYTFSVPETRDYRLDTAQQQTEIEPVESGSNLTLLLIISLVIFTTGGFLFYFLKSKSKTSAPKKPTYPNEPAPVKHSKPSPPQAPIKKVQVEEPKIAPLPHIVYWYDNYTIVGFLNLERRKQQSGSFAFYLENFGEGKLFINKKLIEEANAMVGPSDTIQVEKLFNFEINATPEGGLKAIVHHANHVQLEVIDRGEVIWLFKPISIKIPQVNDIITTQFLRSHKLHIGNSPKFKDHDVNDIVIADSCIDPRHATFKLDEAYNLIIKAAGFLMVNAEMLERNQEKQINDGDKIEIGKFLFSISGEENTVVMQVVDELQNESF